MLSAGQITGKDDKGCRALEFPKIALTCAVSPFFDIKLRLNYFYKRAVRDAEINSGFHIISCKKN